MADFLFGCISGTKISDPITNDSSGTILNDGPTHVLGICKTTGVNPTKSLGFYVNGVRIALYTPDQLLNVPSYPYYNTFASFSADDKLSYIISGSPPEEESECDEDHPCPEGEKCVDGECVPCEKLVDGHGTLTLYGADRVDGTLLADSFQGDWHGSNTHEFYLPNGTPYAGALVIPNGIRANLKISAYYGFFGASTWTKVIFDAPVNQQVVEFNYLPWGDLPFGCLYSSKLLVEVTNYVGLGDCADTLVEPVEPIAPEPPFIEEPETPVEPEPEEPIDKEEHEGEPVEPDKPDKPDQPENCLCENYIANSVQVGADQIFDMLGAVKESIDRLSNNLTKDVDRVSLSINQAANVNNVALAAINANLYNLLMFMSEKLYTELVQFRQDFKENLSCGDRGLACIVEKATLKTVNHPVAGEIEVGLVDSVIDFAGKNIQESVEEIEPVHIENEFRVQSRRTENFIDES